MVLRWMRKKRCGSSRSSSVRTLSLQLSALTDSTVAFEIDQGTGGQPQKRAELTLNRRTGDVARGEPFEVASLGQRLRSILRFAHTGEVLGILGQTIAGLVSLGAALLVWTGLALSWRRYWAWRRRLARK
ncbi:MAG: PepSY domain-containing protein [Rhodothermales bacterium]